MGITIHLYGPIPKMADGRFLRDVREDVRSLRSSSVYSRLYYNKKDCNNALTSLRNDRKISNAACLT